MEQLKNNKMFWVLLVFTVFNVGAFILGKVIVDRAADRVIQKLQKEYSPSPYGPGFDPDKVNPEVFSPSKKYFEMRRSGVSKTFADETLRGVNGQFAVMAAEADTWRDDWETSRVSP
jgi:hypothetical protein